MKYLSLDEILSDVRTPETIEFKMFKFNGGEEHIKIFGTIDPEVVIEFQHPNKIMLLLLAVDALKRKGAKCINLLMPYVPYARQDRVMVPGEPLSIKVFANLINDQGFNKVYTLDNHSPVSTALVNNVVEIDQQRIYREVIRNTHAVTLICPDAGALKKTYAISKAFGGLEVVECSKIRDVSDGSITGVTVHGNDLSGRHCVIFDDICDGGRTFIEIAKELWYLECETVTLYVSHGIFSKGLIELKKLINSIYTTIPFHQQASVHTSVIPLTKGDLL